MLGEALMKAAQGMAHLLDGKQANDFGREMDLRWIVGREDSERQRREIRREGKKIEEESWYAMEKVRYGEWLLQHAQLQPLLSASPDNPEE